MAEMYEFKVVEMFLNKAIAVLRERDPILLDKKFNINERTVTHRLAMYLAEIFSDWDVDCEYNRQYNDDSDEYIKKNIEIEDVKAELSLDDIHAVTVFPDIIVHKRCTKQNLLAIEVKMKWKNSKQNFDKVKAEAYKKRLNYKYSCYITLGNETQINWIDD